MKTLFPKQQESVDFLTNALRANRGALDASLTGTGKTVVACRIALEMQMPVGIICPKIVIPQWERELAEVGITPVFVSNYEKLRRGGQFLTRAGKSSYRWNLADTLLIWDECHRCKASYSLNAQMLVSSKKWKLHNLLLSATTGSSLPEMRSIGYVLGLHSLDKREGELSSFYSWLLKNGCKQDFWGGWSSGNPEAIKKINKQLHEKVCVRLTPNDLPNAFAENHIITESLAFSSLAEIKKHYTNLELSLDALEKLVEENIHTSEFEVVNVLRARQLVELAKVTDIITMADEANEEGYSVVVFVNFDESLDILAAHFKKAAVVRGGQTSAEREANVQKFQTNETTIMLCNTAAGGLGVSLHDVEGTHPRMSFISPSFDVTNYIQALGRIYRVGAKSNATQRVLVAAGTIEERVMKIIEKKRLTMESIYAKPLSQQISNHE